MKKILITGCAGFVGSNLTDKLLSLGFTVVGVDNFNDYYDPKIKEENIKGASKNKDFNLYRVDILDFDKLAALFAKEKPEVVIHLAARAGVRPSLTDPLLYANVNVLGTVNLLKLSVEHKVAKFIFGSSSSVYGDSPKIPFAEDDLCQDIVSPYGASKRAAEFFVESFNKCFGLNTVVLRFFTVYGERGRPDMAPAIFTSSVLKGIPINVFGDGESSRDYTNIEDIVGGILKCVDPDVKSGLFNLGRSDPIKLKDFIALIEKVTGKRAKLLRLERQVGDVVQTWASTNHASKMLGWKPKVGIELGIDRYTRWLKNQS